MFYHVIKQEPQRWWQANWQAQRCRQPVSIRALLLQQQVASYCQGLQELATGEDGDEGL